MASKNSFSIVSPDEAFAFIKDDSFIVTAMAAAEPQIFFSQLHDRIKLVRGVRVQCANPHRAWPCFADESLKEHLELVVMFLTKPVRKLHGRGLVHYVPQHLSQWVTHLRSRQVDVFWGTCSSPDARGFVTLGTSNCYESEVVRFAKNVILEINPNMPRSFGGTDVHVSEVSCFLQHSGLLPQIEAAPYGMVEKAIAEQIAGLVQDGSTIQLGIGGIPNAVAVALQEKNDLGVHTEMINEAIMDLYLKGVVTGRMKTLWPRKIVGAFALGTERLYNFIDNNPAVELHPASVVNDPYRIGRNFQMISINTAVEVDLTGQVCSESIGHLELSGVGGAFETHIGAQRSPLGRGIVALPSTAKNNSISKIVTALTPGAKVSISRNDVDTIVTEYGCAKLRGQTVAERVRAMIAIAHPDFRQELTEQALRFGYI